MPRKLNFKRKVLLLCAVFLGLSFAPCVKYLLVDTETGVSAEPWQRYHPIFVLVVTLCELLLLLPRRRIYLRLVGILLTLAKAAGPLLFHLRLLARYQAVEGLSVQLRLLAPIYALWLLTGLSVALYVREAVHIRKTWGDEPEDHLKYP